MTTTALTDSLKQYTLKYLLAENLFLVGTYHENPIADCMKSLNAYDPTAVVQLASDRIMQQDTKLGSEFVAAMSQVGTGCTGHSVNSSLSNLVKKLQQYR